MRLPNGKTVDANEDVIGIDGEGDVYGGYDRCGLTIHTPPWTAADCVELANAMIARWAAYREKYEGK